MKAGVFALKGLAVAALAMFLCSCGGSDNNGSGGNTSSSSLIGTWQLVSETEGTTTTPVAQLNETEVLTFNADNTFSSVTTDQDGSNTMNGTWSVSGNQLTATPTGESGISTTYTLSGNSLSIDMIHDREVNGSVVNVVVTQNYTRL